jgi:hypothetical protein
MAKGFTIVVAAGVSADMNAAIEEIVAQKEWTKSQWIRGAILQRLEAEGTALPPAAPWRSKQEVAA